jgi:hypothetical protein
MGQRASYACGCMFLLLLVGLVSASICSSSSFGDIEYVLTRSSEAMVLSDFGYHIEESFLDKRG